MRDHLDAVIEPYSFHCTPCGSPHAGECPPRAGGRRQGRFPAEGTYWRKQLRRDIRVRQAGEPEWEDCMVWKVKSFDGAETDNVVILRAGDAGWLEPTQNWPVTAWDEEGVLLHDRPSTAIYPSDSQARIRFWGPIEYSDFKPNP